MPSIPHCVIESRLDWLTVTTTTETNYRAFRNLATEFLRSEASKGNDHKPWRWRNYEGFHCGSATYGERGDSRIMQLSGDMADDWFNGFWLLSDHCTRIDLAVTVKLEDHVGSIAQLAEQECLAWKQETGRALNLSLISSDGHPATLYLGQRVSDLYARLYDKALESADERYRGCWRYELEVKGDPAQRTASYLHAQSNRGDRIASAVHTHFSRRGVTPVFEPSKSSVRIQTYRPPSDAVTRLAWLGRAVRPCVDKLIAGGFRDEVYEALGLTRSTGERIRLKWELEHTKHESELWAEDGAE